MEGQRKKGLECVEHQRWLTEGRFRTEVPQTQPRFPEES